MWLIMPLDPVRYPMEHDSMALNRVLVCDSFEMVMMMGMTLLSVLLPLPAYSHLIHQHSMMVMLIMMS